MLGYAVLMAISPPLRRKIDPSIAEDPASLYFTTEKGIFISGAHGQIFVSTRDVQERFLKNLTQLT
jgi:hypothetical protein